MIGKSEGVKQEIKFNLKSIQWSFNFHLLQEDPWIFNAHLHQDVLYGSLWDWSVLEGGRNFGDFSWYIAPIFSLFGSEMNDVKLLTSLEANSAIFSMTQATGKFLIWQNTIFLYRSHDSEKKAYTKIT